MSQEKRLAPLSIVYIGLSGNTQGLVKHLTEHLLNHYSLDTQTINIKELNHETFPIATPFVVVLPTYLEGGNGIDSGDVEILVSPLGDFITAHDNYKHCFGIIDSGNRSLNEQCCLTAKQYAKRFGFPMLGDFELRGASVDTERLAKVIVEQHQGFANPS